MNENTDQLRTNIILRQELARLVTLASSHGLTTAETWLVVLLEWTEKPKHTDE